MCQALLSTRDTIVKKLERILALQETGLQRRNHKGLLCSFRQFWGGEQGLK